MWHLALCTQEARCVLKRPARPLPPPPESKDSRRCQNPDTRNTRAGRNGHAPRRLGVCGLPELELWPRVTAATRPRSSASAPKGGPERAFSHSQRRQPSALFSHRSLMGSGVIVTGSLAAGGGATLSLTVTADLGEDRARGCCAGLPPLCVYEAADATSASKAARIRRGAARTVPPRRSRVK